MYRSHHSQPDGLSPQSFQSGASVTFSALSASLILALQGCGGAPAPTALASSQTRPGVSQAELSNHFQGSGQSWLTNWAEEPDGPFLWRVEKAGAVSHIFGTVHVGVNLSDLPPVVRERLDVSDRLIVEADTEDMSSPEVVMGLLLPKGQSLRTMLGKKHWKILLKHVGQIFPGPALDRLPPWMVQTMLTLDDPRSAGATDSLDSQLVSRARRQNKRVLYLETAQMQLELLAELIGVKELRETLDDVPAARKGLRVLLRAYRRGNLAALAGLTLDPKDMAENPRHFELMLFQRNRNWMTMLREELGRGGVFVAVGAAHYVGEEGLLELLRADGFMVARVPAVSVK